jgi:exodeoxyribonuclease-3
LKLKIATFNANSIRTRMNIIQNWLSKENPDLLCIQETKVQDKDFPVSQIEEIGYHVIFRGQKAYNGVAIISRSPLEEVRRNLYEDDEQARFISAKVQDIPLINVYVPQGFAIGTEKFDYKLQWLKDLLVHIKKEYDPSKPLLLTGDFNVALEPMDVYDPDGFRGQVGFHENEQAILREYFDWGLVDVFRKHQPEGNHYTFWDYRIPNGFKRNMGWRIDYILATQPLAQKSINVWVDKEPRKHEKPSDHTFLVAEFEV